MWKHRSGTRRVSPLWAAAALFLAAPAAAQQAAPASGLRAELIADVQQLEQKYVGLAGAMAGKYDWRPGAGVRSVGEVFGHVAGSNYMIAGIAGAAMPAGLQRAELQGMEKVTDAGQMQESLRRSFAHVRAAIAGVPDAQLDEQVTMFGQQASKRRVLTLLVTHLHEHLGQAIAYARSNQVTPPWSGAGN